MSNSFKHECWLCAQLEKKERTAEYVCSRCKRPYCSHHGTDFGENRKLCMGCNQAVLAEAQLGYLRPTFERMIKSCLIEEIYPEPPYEDERVQDNFGFENEKGGVK